MNIQHHIWFRPSAIHPNEDCGAWRISSWTGNILRLPWAHWDSHWFGCHEYSLLYNNSNLSLLPSVKFLYGLGGSLSKNHQESMWCLLSRGHRTARKPCWLYKFVGHGNKVTTAPPWRTFRGSMNDLRRRSDVTWMYMRSSSVLSDFRDLVILEFRFYPEYVCASDYFAGICIVWYVTCYTRYTEINGDFTFVICNGPLSRYVKLRVAHAPGMPGTLFPPPMHHGTCVTHVPRCMSGLLTSGFLWSWWRGKRSKHSRHMRNP